MKVNDETKIARLEKSAAVWETRSSFSSQGGERGGWTRTELEKAAETKKA